MGVHGLGDPGGVSDRVEPLTDSRGGGHGSRYLSRRIRLPKPRRSPTFRFRRWWRSRRVIVHDRSMEPTFFAGDRLYVDPGPRTRERSTGRRHRAPGSRRFGPPPDQTDHRPPRGRGRAGRRAGAPRTSPRDRDSPTGSRDSSVFGPVATSEVEGVVWFRYAPSERRGPIGRPTLK